MTGEHEPRRGDLRDDFETRFWMGMVTAGASVTFLMSVVGAVYAIFFAEPEHQLGVSIAVVVAAAGGAVVLWGVPWRRVIASPRREWGFFAWSVSTVAVIAGTAALDGGADSPLAFMLFLPAVFASLAYTIRFVFGVAAFAELAFLALVPMADPDPGYVLGFCGALFGIAVMAVWQAANHDIWRRELRRSSITDPLVGVLNRRGFERASHAAFSGLDREERPVTLVLIDLDLFKVYNDIHGHQAGDDLLRWVGVQLGGAVRPTDSVARLGGDEFAVLLPDTGPAAAEPVIARIKEALTARTAYCLGRASAPEQGPTFDALYRVADADLYRCKLLRPDALLEEGTPEALMSYRAHRATASAGAILAGITEAFYALDEEWRFTYVNEPAEELLGRAAHELLGRSIWTAFEDPGEEGSVFRETLLRVVETGQSETFTEFYGPLDRTFSIKASPLAGGVSVYLHDVTAREPAPHG